MAATPMASAPAPTPSLAWALAWAFAVVAFVSPCEGQQIDWGLRTLLPLQSVDAYWNCLFAFISSLTLSLFFFFNWLQQKIVPKSCN